MFLSAYIYSIEFRPTEAHSNADSLSRLPLPASTAVRNSVDAQVFNMGQIEALPVHSSEVAAATQKDVILSRILAYLKQSWPQQVPEALLPYWRKRNEFTVESGCVLWGMRVVIPSRLMQAVVSEIHVGHQGVSRMKILARSYVWWPDLDHTIEATVKECAACQGQHNSPAKVTSVTLDH